MTRATVNIDSKSINSSLTRRAAFAGVALLAAPSTALAVCVAPDGTHPIEPSWFALTGLAIYVIASSNAGSPMRRGALVFLAITVPMCWGPFFLHVFSRPFLWSDALFVSNLIGTEQIGNLVKFADGSGYFQIFPQCSSYHNMSLALLAWISVIQFVRHKSSPQDIFWCLLAVLSVLVVNVTRIALMGLYREHFDTIHGFGSAIADLVSLSLISAFCILGVRREIFARP